MCWNPSHRSQSHMASDNSESEPAEGTKIMIAASDDDTAHENIYDTAAFIIITETTETTRDSTIGALQSKRGPTRQSSMTLHLQEQILSVQYHQCHTVLHRWCRRRITRLAHQSRKGLRRARSCGVQDNSRSQFSV